MKTEQSLDLLLAGLFTVGSVLANPAWANIQPVMSYAYDDAGNLISSTDGLNRITTNSYDALNRIEQVTDAMSNPVGYTYDERDNLVGVTDQLGLTTSYEYDGFDQLVRLTSPDTGITTYTYDEAGNQHTKTDSRGVTAVYGYDALNRVKSINYPDSSKNVTYVYDTCPNGVGRLCKINDESGSTQYQYDTHGNVIEELRTYVTTDALGNTTTHTVSTEYAYDRADNLALVGYANGRLIMYHRDAAGRVTAITTNDTSDPNNPDKDSLVVSNIDYQPFGPVKTLTHANGVVLNQSHDLDYRLMAQTETGSSNSTIRDQQYTYDAVSNISGILDQLNTNHDQDFVYDPLDRLISADGDYGQQDFTYDPVGNRLTQDSTPVGSTATTQQQYDYEVAAHQLAMISDSATTDYRTYDAVGNTITRDRGGMATDFIYDDQNRLSEVKKHNESIARYVFNAMGQRTQKVVIDTTDYAALAAQFNQQAQTHRDNATALQLEADLATANAQAATNLANELIAEATDFRAQADDFQQQVAGKQAAYDQTQADIADLTTQLNDKAQQAADLTQQKDALQGEINVLQTQATDLTQQANQIQQQIDTLNASAQDNQQQAAAMQQQAAQYESDAQALLAQIPELQAQRAQLQTRIDALNQQAQPYLDKISKIEEKIDKRQARIVTLEKQIADLQARIMADSVGKKDRKKNRHLKKRIRQLKYQIRIVQWLINWQEKNIARLQSKADVYLVEAQGLSAQADALRQKIANDQQQAQQWLAEADTLHEEAYQRQQLAQQQLQDSNALELLLAPVLVEIDSVNNKIAPKQAEVQLLMAQLDQLSNEVASLNGQIEAQQQQASQLLAEIDELNNQIADLLASADANDLEAPNQQQLAATYTQQAAYLQQQANDELQLAAADQQQADEYTAIANDPSRRQYSRFFVYDLQGQLIGEYDEKGNIIQEVVWLGSQPVAMIENNTVYAIHTDQLNTPRMITNTLQQAVWEWDSDPFGNNEPVGILTFNHRFPGQYYDSETGQHYNYFRDYDPGAGRYVQSDPIGLGGGINTYGYALSNPINYYDPDGRIIPILAGIAVRHAAKYLVKKAVQFAQTQVAIGMANGAVAGAAGGFSSSSNCSTPDEVWTNVWQGAAIGALTGSLRRVRNTLFMSGFLGSLAGQIVANPNKLPNMTVAFYSGGFGSVASYAGKRSMTIGSQYLGRPFFTGTATGLGSQVGTTFFPNTNPLQNMVNLFE